MCVCMYIHIYIYIIGAAVVIASFDANPTNAAVVSSALGLLQAQYSPRWNKSTLIE